MHVLTTYNPTLLRAHQMLAAAQKIEERLRDAAEPLPSAAKARLQVSAEVRFDHALQKTGYRHPLRIEYKVVAPDNTLVTKPREALLYIDAAGRALGFLCGTCEGDAREHHRHGDVEMVCNELAFDLLEDITAAA